MQDLHLLQRHSQVLSVGMGRRELWEQGCACLADVFTNFVS